MKKKKIESLIKNVESYLQILNDVDPEFAEQLNKDLKTLLEDGDSPVHKAIQMYKILDNPVFYVDAINYKPLEEICRMIWKARFLIESIFVDSIVRKEGNAEQTEKAIINLIARSGSEALKTMDDLAADSSKSPEIRNLAKEMAVKIRMDITSSREK